MKFNLIFCLIVLLQAQDPKDTPIQDENPTIVEASQQVVQPIIALSNNIDALISDHRLILIEFYASLCAPCKQFALEYQQLTEKASKHSITCAGYDSQKDSDRYALEKFKIQSFPTFIFLWMVNLFYLLDKEVLILYSNGCYSQSMDLILQKYQHKINLINF